MSDKVIEYLESHREITITMDTSPLVNTVIETWKFLKEDFKQKTGNELTLPKVQFNTNYIEYLQLDLSWDKDEHH